MADKTIGGLTAGTALSGAELMEIEQGGNSRRTTTQDVADQAIGIQADTDLVFNWKQFSDDTAAIRVSPQKGRGDTGQRHTRAHRAYHRIITG